MSKDLNQAHFIGRLGRDPEMRALPNGTEVVNFSIACSDDYKDKTSGQLVEQTEWINIVAFGKLAEIMSRYLAKGSRVYISGKFTTRKWEKDGVTRYSSEIKANEMIMLDGKGDGQAAPRQDNRTQRAQQPQQQAMADDFDDQDIPF